MTWLRSLLGMFLLLKRVIVAVIKYETEKASLKRLLADLSEPLSSEIFGLWVEFEQQHSVEATLARCFDILEAHIQHGLADSSTWDEGDFRLGIYYQDQFFDLDLSLRQLKDAINKTIMEQIIQAGLVDQLPEEQIAQFYQHRDRPD